MAALGRRRFWLQAGVLVGVAVAAAWIAGNVAVNLERLGVQTGFAFLARPAGFEIAQRLIPYAEQSSYFAAFVVALLNTVAVSAVSIALATVLGFAIGFARLSRNRLLAGVAQAYVEIVRNVPLLLQLLFWYFAVLRPLPAPRDSLSLFGLAYLNNRGLFLPAPIVDRAALILVGAAALGLLLSSALWALQRRYRIHAGRPSPRRWLMPVPALALPLAALAGGARVGWSVPVLAGFNFDGGLAVIPEFVAMALGLSVYAGAFIAEIVRAGVRSVPRGQVESALSLGLPRLVVNWKIVVPLALRFMVPPLGAHYVVLLKNSSLAAAIAYPDLMLIFAGTALNQTGQPLEIMVITLATYLLLNLALAGATGALNRRLKLVER